MKDEIVLGLNETLKNFLHFFTNDLQRKVLELEKNAESSSNYKQLERISNSLEQYLKKDRDLFYVGLLGSYSSGKSSTINSLLSLWDTDKSRRVSNNPTDSNITLITNQSNIDSVFTFLKEGAVSIRTNTSFQNKFLDNIVLMDTPGSGDPNIIESIVRDSLPLCDLILYTLNATAPFTDIDKPFLIAQQTKLKNIPILFVITRGEEFKMSHSIKLDTSSFNQSKYENELEVLIERINETIGSSFTSNNFILIDNLSLFNINHLKEKIKEYTSNNQENLIMLHNHKLNYFKTEINNVYKFYHELSNNKIQKCESFNEKAKSNIDLFNQQIDVSKNKFKGIWNNYSENINNIYNGTAKGYLESTLNEITELNVFFNSATYKILKDNILDKLKSKAEIEAGNLILNIEQKAFKEIMQFKQQISDLINYENFTLNELNNTSESFDYELCFPLKVNDIINDLEDHFIINNRQIIQVISKHHTSINRSLTSTTPIDKIQSNISEYISHSLEVIETYYNAVTMYHAAAFSYEVKNYISDLGLAHELDNIGSTEINRTKYNARIKDVLLNEINECIKTFREEVSLILKKSEKLKIDIDNMKTSNIGNLSFNEKELNPINTIISKEDFIQTSYQKLISNTNKQLSEVKKQINKIKSIRRRNYLLYPILTLILFSLIYLAYEPLSSEIPNTYLATTIVGIIGSILAGVIVNLSDKFKTKKEAIISDFRNDLQIENDRYIEEAYEKFKIENKSLKNKTTDSIYNKWKTDFEKIILFFHNNINIDEETHILETKNKFKDIISSYRTQYDYLHKKLSDYFYDHDRNLKKIEAIASEIKNDSIQPSFDLLMKTLEEINSVKSEIELLRN